MCVGEWHPALSGVPPAVSGAPGPYRAEPATIGFLQALSNIIHRTIRCATGLSGAPAEQRLSSATVDCNDT
jgi:hypothetical protein